MIACGAVFVLRTGCDDDGSVTIALLAFHLPILALLAPFAITILVGGESVSRTLAANLSKSPVDI